MTTTHPCTLCGETWTCSWCEEPAVTERAKHYANQPPTLRGHDVRPDLSGIEVSAMRYANFARERRLVREEVAA